MVVTMEDCGHFWHPIQWHGVGTTIVEGLQKLSSCKKQVPLCPNRSDNQLFAAWRVLLTDQEARNPLVLLQPALFLLLPILGTPRLR